MTRDPGGRGQRARTLTLVWCRVKTGLSRRARTTQPRDPGRQAMGGRERTGCKVGDGDGGGKRSP